MSFNFIQENGTSPGLSRSHKCSRLNAILKCPHVQRAWNFECIIIDVHYDETIRTSVLIMIPLRLESSLSLSSSRPREAREAEAWYMPACLFNESSLSAECKCLRLRKLPV